MSEPNVGVLMFVAHRALEQRVLAALHDAGFGDTTMAQGRVFARIGENVPASPNWRRWPR